MLYKSLSHHSRRMQKLGRRVAGSPGTTRSSPSEMLFSGERERVCMPDGGSMGHRPDLVPVPEEPALTCEAITLLSRYLSVLTSPCRAPALCGLGHVRLTMRCGD